MSVSISTDILEYTCPYPRISVNIPISFFGYPINEKKTEMPIDDASLQYAIDEALEQGKAMKARLKDLGQHGRALEQQREVLYTYTIC
jgi:hypothetical protein